MFIPGHERKHGRYGCTGVVDFKHKDLVLSRINFILDIPYKQSCNDRLIKRARVEY